MTSMPLRLATSTGQLMTDAHRDAIEWLLGEELADEEWEGFDYWYDGAPSYSEFPEWCNEWEYRTAFVDELLGRAPTPEGWERVASFSHSGEAPCPWQGCDLGEEVCSLCEQIAESARHPYEGWLYIGDGWREVIYRRRRED